MFIALDNLIQHVRDHDFVDIYGLVAELRSERMCMVQNLVSSLINHCVLFLRLRCTSHREQTKGGGKKERKMHPVFGLNLFQRWCRCPTFYFVSCCHLVPHEGCLTLTKGMIWHILSRIPLLDEKKKEAETCPRIT